jgi:hypothetical protein
MSPFESGIAVSHTPPRRNAIMGYAYGIESVVPSDTMVPKRLVLVFVGAVVVNPIWIETLLPAANGVARGIDRKNRCGPYVGVAALPLTRTEFTVVRPPTSVRFAYNRIPIEVNFDAV